jgi:hypothetical protein
MFYITCLLPKKSGLTSYSMDIFRLLFLVLLFTDRIYFYLQWHNSFWIYILYIYTYVIMAKFDIHSSSETWFCAASCSFPTRNLIPLL